MTARALDEADEAEVVTRYRAGASTWRLAGRFGTSQPTILRILVRHGVQTRPTHGARSDVDTDEVVRLRDAGLTWPEVGRMVQMSANGARRRYVAATCGVSPPKGDGLP